jgi:hypothetical protein
MGQNLRSEAEYQPFSLPRLRRMRRILPPAHNRDAQNQKRQKKSTYHKKGLHPLLLLPGALPVYCNRHKEKPPSQHNNEIQLRR